MQEKPESEAKDTVQEAERETPRVLQLLRSDRELCQFGAVLPASDADTVQMAKPAQSTAQFQLARVSGTVRGIPYRTAPDSGAAQD